MGMLLIAHRCGPAQYPEQTVASARQALKLGADMVEMDVRITSDGIPVISHDENVERIFGPDRLVSEMTFAEFMQLRHRVDCSYSSHSLENVLACGVQPLLLHCKISGQRLDPLLKCVISAGVEKECVLGLESPEDFDYVRRVSAEVRTLAFMPSVEQMEDFLLTRADVIRLWEAWVTPERIERIHAAGKKVWIMAGGTQESETGYTDQSNISIWQNMGADGILINDVEWAKAGIFSE